MKKAQTGVLLINLGTPAAPHKKAIKNYLKEFLGDARVVDLPAGLRKLLLTFIILPFRSPKTAQAYQTIWDPEKGSPLLYHSQIFSEQLQHLLGNEFKVALAMRYGQPSIVSAVEALVQTCEKIILLPLFPQYSSAATGSALEKALSYLSQKWDIPHLSVLRSFHDFPAYIAAQAQLIKPYLEQYRPEKLIFSYHSLPKRHLTKSQASCFQECLHSQQPCEVKAAQCYRAQCFETSRLLAKQLELNSTRYQVAFQSRLGRIPWIGPDFRLLMKQLRQEGKKNILVVCPSFVADCLETLEEIGIRAKEEWLALGGEQFNLVPALNAQPQWVKAVSQLVLEPR